MRNKVLGVLLALILFTGLVSAAAPSAITSVTGEYAGACIKFEWTVAETDAPGFDLNLYRVQTVSNVGKFNGWDNNYSATGAGTVAVTSMNFCTAEGGDYVRLIVTPIDSNTDYGNYEVPQDQNKWMGTDNNTLITAPTAIAAGQFAIYTVFLTIATLAGIIVMIAVLAVILQKLKLQGTLKMS